MDSRDAGAPTAPKRAVVIHLHQSGLLTLDQKPGSLEGIGAQLRAAVGSKAPLDVIIETDLPQTDPRFAVLRDKLAEVGVTRFALASRIP